MIRPKLYFSSRRVVDPSGNFKHIKCIIYNFHIHLNCCNTFKSGAAILQMLSCITKKSEPVFDPVGYNYLHERMKIFGIFFHPNSHLCVSWAMRSHFFKVTLPKLITLKIGKNSYSTSTMCIDEFTESTDLIFKIFQKNHSSRDTFPIIDCSLFRQDERAIQYTAIHVPYCIGIFSVRYCKEKKLFPRGISFIGLLFT
jgi:hypothetical protein